MKEAVTSFDLIVVVSELQSLVGGRIDKVYQDEDDFYLKVNISRGGRQEVYIKPGKWLCLRESGEKPETPPPFTQALRRYITNASITSIEQRGFDRVVVFNLQAEKKYQLIFELFGGGNLVLVEDGRTILCKRTQILKNRQIKVSTKYDFPPTGVNPLELDRDEFHERLKVGKRAVAKVLASDFNLGGLYAEELCLMAGVDGKFKASTLSDEQVDGLFTVLNNLIVAVEDDIRPTVIIEDNKAIDVVPIELRTYSNNEQSSFNTFSEALVHYLDTIGEFKVKEELDPRKEIVARYQRRLDQQEESLVTLNREAAKYELQAQFLYSHFQEFDQLLQALREGREPHGFEIKSIDHEKKIVTVRVAEDDSIELDYRKDVNANAQIMYRKRREAQERASRVNSAIVETRQEMEQAMRRAIKVAEVTKAKPTKKFWFETYRWFISSEGFIVIAGRDAKSNESVVKKHLKEGDRYAHADMHGAPSVVVKEGSKAGEQTLKEACEFTLSYSKAWSSKVASGSAYWVMPEQVSKTAESGEYIPRGAFVIRGRRNYLKDLEVRVAVGEIEHTGHKKVMAGPVSAITAVSNRYAILEPGEMSKEGYAKSLAHTLSVPVEEVSRVLPPGSLRIIKSINLKIPEE